MAAVSPTGPAPTRSELEDLVLEDQLLLEYRARPRHVLEFADVRAGAEGLVAFAGEDQRANGVIAFEVSQRRVELPRQRQRDDVHRRVGEEHDGMAAVALSVPGDYAKPGDISVLGASLVGYVQVDKDAHSNQIKKNSPIPWHPGAERYFTERGVKM